MEIDARESEKSLSFCCLKIDNVFCVSCLTREGSGNFLIVTYKELRRLEIEIYELIVFIKQKTFIYEPSIKLSQFYGIEIDDFAHDVAMLSLWIADHQMNIELKERLQNAFRNTLPLQKVGAIRCANSL